MMHGHNNGKKNLAIAIVKQTFEIINPITRINPLETVPKAFHLLDLEKTAAVQVVKTLDSSQRIPDGARNYMSKIFNEDWLLDNHLISQSEYMEFGRQCHLQLDFF
jgi:hypothetical protein